jgi:CheY-like chemotaxis protein
MNGILGMTGLALEATSPDEQREYLQLVQSSGETLLTLINDILDLSKIEAGKLELETVGFDPRVLLRETVKLMQWRTAQKGLTLECAVSAGVPAAVAGDPSRLRQVLINLIGNAVKFTEHGSIHLSVGMAAGGESATTEALRFAVTDTGIGIAADKQAAVFEQFTQADGSITRRYGGTGLGLAISSKLVAAMGGQLSVESHLGIGSTFHFTISLAPCELAAEAADPSFRSNVVTTGSSLSILVAEDNKVNQFLALRLLQKQGHEVAVVANGTEALALLETRLFDVVLMDLQMPEMDGFHTTAAIRESERGTDRHQQIVAMTAHAFKEDRDRCLAAGMDDYVSKPISVQALNTVLGRVRPSDAPALAGAIE